MAKNRNDEALKLLERVIKLNPDVEKHVRHVGAMIKWPMETVLAKVPGETIKERAAKLGISRQAYYSWLNETYRPNPKQAKRLEQLTGIPADDIRGAA